MAGQNRVHLASVLGFFVVICSSTISFCHEPSKERVFFNGVDPDMKTVREVHAPIGGLAVLECEAGGTPAPLIHWLRNGQRIDQGGALGELVVGEETLSYENTDTNRRLSTLQLSATRSRLFVDCVGHSDAGLYVCVAETPTRRTAIEYHLRIDHSIQSDVLVNNCLMKNRGPGLIPARIYMWTLHRVEVEGADVQLYCRPTGSGPVKVTWFDRNGDAITKQDKQYQVEDNGDLMVKSISFADNMGLYRCIAENSLGTDAVDTFLYPAAREKKLN